MPIRALPWIFLAALLAASPLAGAQTMDDATGAIDKKDYAKARDILEKLVQQGNVAAEVRLADMYIRPLGISQNKPRGSMLYESAAQKGNAEALYFVGTEHMKPTGGLFRPDRKRGVGMLSTSAKQKYAAAQVALCFELSTQGAEPYDAVEAYAWCETASNKEHRQAREAGKRAKALLKSIEDFQKPEMLQAAKIRAAKYTKSY